MTRPLTPEGEALLRDEMHGRFQAAIDDAYPYGDLTEEMFHDRLAAIEQAAVARQVARLSRLPRTSTRDGTETGRMVVDWADLSAVLAEDDPPDEDVSKVIAKARAEAHVRQTLIDHGVDSVENQGLHGWRCRYPDTYGGGPCDCFDELVAALLAVPEAQEDDRE